MWATVTRGLQEWLRIQVYEWAETYCQNGWVVARADGTFQFHEILTAGLFTEGAVAIPVHDQC